MGAVLTTYDPMARRLHISIIVLGVLGLLSGASPGGHPSTRTSKAFSPGSTLRSYRDVSVEGTGKCATCSGSRTRSITQARGRLGRGQIDPVTQGRPGDQRIFDAPGGFTEQNVGQFYYHAPHQHGTTTTGATTSSGPRRSSTPGSPAVATGALPMRSAPRPRVASWTRSSSTTSRDALPGAIPVLGLLAQRPGADDPGPIARLGRHLRLLALRAVDRPRARRTSRTASTCSARSPIPRTRCTRAPTRRTRRARRGRQRGHHGLTVQNGNILDSAKPSGTVAINDVDASTASKNVTVKVIGRDDVSGVDTVRLSNNGTTWSNPISYTSTGLDRHLDLVGPDQPGLRHLHGRDKDGLRPVPRPDRQALRHPDRHDHLHGRRRGERPSTQGGTVRLAGGLLAPRGTSARRPPTPQPATVAPTSTGRSSAPPA